MMTLPLTTASTNSEYETDWKPPHFDVSCPPEPVLTSHLDLDPDFTDNFPRSVRWYVSVNHRSTNQLSHH